ncbi:MAG TPA: ATP-binding protein [Pyrinomonadaceae bacterium]|nr:ATP-binding protein [Pyrinomonadaceae bacterium]
MAPAKTLREAYNAANPAEPLQPGDSRYVDCTDVRGDEDTVRKMFKIISYSDRPTHQLFTGHRGCGKSTELLRLKKRLEEDGFYVVYFAADKDLDPNDLIYTDLLLSVARRVVAQTAKDGIDLGDALKTVETWFSEVIYKEEEWRRVEQELKSEAELGLSMPKGVASKLPFIGHVLTRLTEQIKTGDEIKKEIRQRLDSQIPQLISGLNDLLHRADVEVQRKKQKGVAVIVDNLDRVTNKDLGGGRTSHDALFIEHGEQLCALRCHTIYTVPISMMYGLSARNLGGIFDRSHVLPMIRSHEPRAKGGGPSKAGMQKLRDIIAQRIDVDALCDPAAVEYFCLASGGHPRDLMTLVRSSIEDADEGSPKPITQALARRAEDQLVSAFARMIPEEYFDKLAAVYETNKIKKDSDHQKMLFSQSVLEYSSEPEEAETEKEPWHDVHPAVQRLKSFREALNERSKLKLES